MNRRSALTRLGQGAPEAAIVALGNLGTLLIGLLGIRLLTHVLNKSEFGVYALALTAVGFAQQLFYGPLSSASLRFASVFNPPSRAIVAAISIASKRTVILAIASVIACLVIVAIGQSAIGVPLVTAVIYSACIGSASIRRSSLRAKRLRAQVALFDNFSAALRWIPAAVAGYFGGSATYAMLGLSAGGVLDLVAHRRLIKTDRQVTIPSDAADVAAFALPFSILGIAIWGRLATERWALNGFESPEAVAVYAVLALTISRPIEIGATGVTSLFSPILFQRAGSGSTNSRLDSAHKLNLRLVYGALAGGVVVVVLAFAFGPQFIRLIAGDEFAVPSWMPACMALAGSLWASGHLSGLIFMSSLEPRMLYAPQISSQTIGVAAAIIGASFGGVDGVVIAGVIASAVFAGLSIRAALNATGAEFETRDLSLNE